MQPPVYPISELLIRLAALIAAEFPTVGDNSLLHLFKNDVVPDENMTLATFEDADFAGYAPVEIVMNAPSMNDTGMIVSKSNLCNFASAAGVDTQMIYGVYITNPDGDAVIAAQRFATPQVMGGVYPQAITGVWRTSEPMSSYGWIDVEN